MCKLAVKERGAGHAMSLSVLEVQHLEVHTWPGLQGQVSAMLRLFQMA